MLRFALGLGNAVIATRDPDTGEVRGLAMDLLPELAARLGVPFATFEYVQAEEAIQAIEDGVWDVGFVPVGSPLPADEEWLSRLDVTPPLVEFENTYLVPADSPIETHADADQPGRRIVVVAGTSTEGFLSRMLEHAELITVPGRPAALELLASGQVDAWAGTPFALQPFVPRLPGAVMFEGSFASHRISLGIPKGRPAGLQYVSEFAEDVKASGRVQEALDRNPLPGVHAVTGG